jgi:hypothetical protein
MTAMREGSRNGTILVQSKSGGFLKIQPVATALKEPSRSGHQGDRTIA